MRLIFSQNHPKKDFCKRLNKLANRRIRLTQVHTISCVSIQRLAPTYLMGKNRGDG